jgi:hypothetical protein
MAQCPGGSQMGLSWAMWGVVVDSGEKWGLGFGSVGKPTTGSEHSDGKE